ncbi:MAG TPA: C4-type zinc ribbon domain-containing protein [Actinomycetota bacterium]|nr:C4-type zinc ribbon domain-containing protein [Actinomycetota bacterium]
MKGLDRILELQDLDLVVDRLEHRREELESGEELRAARTRATEAEDRVGEVRLALDAARREQERLEAETGTLDLKIGAEEKRLYDGSVANPKELESIQHEIAALRHRKSRLEDETLVHMEEREGHQSRLPALETELEEARKRVAEIGGSSAEELDRIATQLEQRRAARAELTPAFDPELLELYEDLRAQKKGVGAAALVDGVCGGCRQQLSPLELQKVKRTEGVRRCEYCRRILVLD